jgi:hypothetical protein
MCENKILEQFQLSPLSGITGQREVAIFWREKGEQWKSGKARGNRKM